MFESSFPPDKQSLELQRVVECLQAHYVGASAAEKRALYSGTAVRVYRLAVP